MSRRASIVFFIVFLFNPHSIPFVFANDSKIEELLREAARHKSFHQNDLAIQEYEEAKRLQPGNPEILHGLGVLYFETENYEKAAGLLKASLEANNRDPLVHYYLAESFVKLGNAQGAAEEYKNALDLDPNLVQAEYGLSLLLENQGDVSTAKEHYRSVTVKDPNHVGAFFQLGIVAYQEGNLQEAEKYFERASLIDSKMAPAHYNLGLVLMKLGDFEKARNEFKKAITLDPSNPAGFFQAAVAYEEQGFLNEAASGYEEALRLNPNWAEARQRLQAVRNKLTDKEEEMNDSAEPRRSTPIFSGSFGKGGFEAGTPFDPLGNLAQDNTGAPKTSGKALLFQAGAAVLQQWLNSRTAQSHAETQNNSN